METLENKEVLLTTKLEKKYNSSFEEDIIKRWQEAGIFKFNSNTTKPVFSIDSPPPYASGDIHVGHMLSYGHFEFAARYWRMKGFEVFYPFGFDDNGLPTERSIEKKYNIKASKMLRKEFVDLCLKETKEMDETYKNIFTRMGHSMDWSLSYNTINPFCTKMAQKSFIDLFKKGRVERTAEPTIWCPFCQTALAQDDMGDKDEESFLNTILFEFENGEKIKIATTRPEFLPACGAVFVNPFDKRYVDLIGKKAKVPLFDYEVPIMADDKVDKDFGTGLVMVCTFGDQTDIIWWRKYGLHLKVLLNKDGTLTDIARKYKGMKSKDARAQVIEDLKEKGLLFEQKKINHIINVHERCNTPVEFLVSPQWKIKQLDLKDKLIEQGRKIIWSPEFMRSRYENWVAGLKWDWIISRQRYFGVPFPIWYCKRCGKAKLADLEDLPVYPTQTQPTTPCECGSTDFEPEFDVMDTWMTSSITPLLAAKWGEKDSLIDKVYPFSLRPQGHDIIRTWAYYTILKSYLHTNSIPWKTIALSGWGLDQSGKKMSKSKGNIVDPRDVIKKYSADALRWWGATVKIGEDFCYKEQDVQDGFKFLNKIWNAANFVGLFFDKNVFEENNTKIAKNNARVLDKWVIQKFRKSLDISSKAIESYNYGDAKKSMFQFFKQYFCDNYLEFIKWRIYSEKDQAQVLQEQNSIANSRLQNVALPSNSTPKEAKQSAQYYVAFVLKNSLKLFHPFIPFITEKIWIDLFEEKTPLAIASWPGPSEFEEDEEAEKIGDFALKVIEDIRMWKASNNKSVAYDNFSLDLTFPAFLNLSNSQLDEIVEDIKNIARAKEMNVNIDKEYKVVCKNLEQV